MPQGPRFEYVWNCVTSMKLIFLFKSPFSVLRNNKYGHSSKSQTPSHALTHCCSHYHTLPTTCLQMQQETLHYFQTRNNFALRCTDNSEYKFLTKHEHALPVTHPQWTPSAIMLLVVLPPVTARHNDTRDLVSMLANQLVCPLSWKLSHQRPGNISIPNWPHWSPAAVDVTLTCSLQSTVIKRAAEEVGYACKLAEERKCAASAEFCHLSGFE